MDKLKVLLQEYKQNMDRQQELDASLLVEQSREQWVDSLKKRAKKMHLMYKDSQEILDQLDKQLSTLLTLEDAERLYLEVQTMYWDDYDDCQILLPLLYKLIEYYETNEDLDKLIFLYSATYYEESEILNRRIGTKETLVDYNLKIISYSDRYCQFEEFQTRLRILTAYYNIIVIGLANKTVDLKTSYQYLLQVLNLWNAPEIQALDGSNERCRQIIKRIRYEWLVSQEQIKDADKEMQEYFCKEADCIFNERLNEEASLFNIESETYSAYLHSQVLTHKMTYDEITDRYLEYCNHKIEMCINAENISDEDSYFLINAPLTFASWMEYGISADKKNRILRIVREITQKNFHEKLVRFSAPFVNEIMAEWCFSFLKHLDSQEEKEEWLFRLLVRRQLPTYLHAVMVSHLTEKFYSHIAAVRPELFATLPQNVKHDIPKFIRQCALLHDIGKTKITDIVNTQIRCLCDKEFQGIRQHPEYGATMIGSDKDLSVYHDIILGHHKFYNGKGGYPESFDNTTSPYRIIIDLITLCDCLDAASDHFGRNYKTSKTLEEILEEFKAEKGTRYNPDLVDILVNSTELQADIRYTISEGRIGIMYEAYKNHFF